MSEHSNNNSLVTSTWDVVVIGAGIGEATIGWELANSGLRIFF